jgi:glycosyltransferase 2 family protein
MQEIATRARTLLRRLAPPIIGIAALAAVVWVVQPADVVRAFEGFRAVVLVPVVGLLLLAYVVQGARWHGLLRSIGARLSVADSMLLNAAGQGITAVLPLGDLTRAVFASETGGAEFPDVVATVTVQELTYTLLLLLAAGPVVLDHREALGVEVIALVGMAAIVAILVVPPLFVRVHWLVARTPLLRRFAQQIDELRNETVVLLHRPATLLWSGLDAVRVLLVVTAFWLLVIGVRPGVVDWWSAAFVFSLSYVGGAVSLLPGGVGANEAGMVGLLIVVGVEPGAAAAIAVLMRFVSSVLAVVVALAAYAAARRRFPELSSLTAIRRRTAGGAGTA